jgi:hypothetical protein
MADLSCNKNKQIMKKIFLLLSLFIFSCSDNSFDLNQRVYVYKDDNQMQRAAFDGDTVYMKWDDSLGVVHFKTKFSASKLNDTTYILELENIPDFWVSNKWEIVTTDDGFYTKESGKQYRLQTKRE